MPILSLILAQAGLFGAEPVPDPLAGITADWQLCIEPDNDAKTCHLMSSFTMVGEDQYSEVYRFAVMGLPGLIIEIAGTGHLKNGRLCSVARLKDFERARIVQHVEGATPQQEAAALKSLRFGYPIEGKEICSAFYPDGVHFRMESFANGKPMPEITERVRWVHKDDGYKVAGWQGAITTPIGAAR